MKYMLTWSVIHANDIANREVADTVNNMVDNSINSVVFRDIFDAYHKRRDAYDKAMNALSLEHLKHCREGHNDVE